jgi:hypothetical protein
LIPESNETTKSHYQLIPERPEHKKEKESKTISIKGIVSEGQEDYITNEQNTDIKAGPSKAELRETLNPEGFASSWKDFVSDVSSDGTRIASMFKTIKPEFREENKILFHLSNEAQRDMFDLNYKQRLISYLSERFKTGAMIIETIVDLSEENGIIYSDEQKYSFLSSKYPIIKDMKKAFNLDIE